MTLLNDKAWKSHLYRSDTGAVCSNPQILNEMKMISEKIHEMTTAYEFENF